MTIWITQKVYIYISNNNPQNLCQNTTKEASWNILYIFQYKILYMNR